MGNLGIWRPYRTLCALRNGEVVEIEGVRFRMKSGEIEVGDFYIAERNTGPHLLTAKVINRELECIVPIEDAYPYDLWECVRVQEVE